MQSTIHRVTEEPNLFTGDHGDEDLELALTMSHESGRDVALVTFGHMHQQLQEPKRRRPSDDRRNMVSVSRTGMGKQLRSLTS